MAEQENGSSPLAEALARVGEQWTLLVVEALLGGRGGSMTCSARSRDRREPPPSASSGWSGTAC